MAYRKVQYWDRHYLLCLNNLFYQKFEGNIVSFADNTAVFYTNDTWAALLAKAENHFTKKNWFHA